MVNYVLPCLNTDQKGNAVTVPADLSDLMDILKPVRRQIKKQSKSVKMCRAGQDVMYGISNVVQNIQSGLPNSCSIMIDSD